MHVNFSRTAFGSPAIKLLVAIVIVFAPFFLTAFVTDGSESELLFAPGKRCTTCREQKDDGRRFLESFTSKFVLTSHIQAYTTALPLIVNEIVKRDIKCV